MPRPKEEYTVKSNGHIDPDIGYGQPVLINAATIPSRASATRWNALYQDIMLRLEQTPQTQALAFPFATYAVLKSAKAAIFKRSLKDYGADFVTLIVRKQPPTLFVRRGPNWDK